MQIHHVLEVHCDNRRIVQIGHFDAVIQAQVALDDLSARHVPRVPNGLISRRGHGGEFLALLVERYAVVV